ncbi:2-oxo-4-hydroxy-4-carboxy-5-ureidoimidazoline decarboxylase [Vibrio hippocampi]|uniref:2-oxo-4-hydroxy-4-carboxy-5-ureidoimidazoline decarboxylase n=1 Tax=Vibrio hippocampi TaxID=654686 RepID=A0ABM8ZJI0_9VIBR|nr:2-oxo-4-hydroxy-4-carboxy-5-ureidoimidazoline decarboxylase [Vibrio hippocampi]CAH0526193.1 Uric acid degradation bifunctional protein PucL [Vibrio hippocampi]
MTLMPTTLTLSNTQLAQICTSQRWQYLMQRNAPFADYRALCLAADQAFSELNESDWLEAFAGHPMIGDLSTLEKKYSQGKQLSAHEQAGVNNAEQAVLEQLLTLNQAYLDKFGFIFIVCASEKSASEMLTLLTQRINNPRNQELITASVEQRKISQLRLEVYQ